MRNKEIIFSLLKPMATIMSSIGGKKLFILIYHQVLEKPDFMRPSTVDKVAFNWQMSLLAHYFNVLPLDEAIDRLKRSELPPRAVCITFDDGYSDNYTQALPILQRYNLPATFFIASGYLDGGRMWNDTVIESIRSIESPELDLSEIHLGVYDLSSPSQKYQTAQAIIRQIKHLDPELRNDYTTKLAVIAGSLPNNLMMTTQQLLLLQQAGMEIGGHTVTHPILAKLSNTEAQKEIVDNKSALEAILNREINYFAYPNGKPGQDYSENQVDMVKQAGYLAALSTQWGVVRRQADLWQLPRFTPWDNDPVKFMLRMVYWFGKK